MPKYLPLPTKVWLSPHFNAQDMVRRYFSAIGDTRKFVNETLLIWQSLEIWRQIWPLRLCLRGLKQSESVNVLEEIKHRDRLINIIIINLQFFLDSLYGPRFKNLK
jgi:hypothetical protein